MVSRNERGALLIPCLLLTMIVASTGFGIWGLLRSYRKRVEHQLQLDQCVGKKAMELKSILSKLTASNTRMVWVRRSAVFGILEPDALEVIRMELEAEVIFQEGLRVKWLAEGAASAVGKACPDIKAIPVRYPFLAWRRPMEDFIGPQPFSWNEKSPKFELLFTALPLHSAATVQGDSNAKNWIAKWSDLY